MSRDYGNETRQVLVAVDRTCRLRSGGERRNSEERFDPRSVTNELAIGRNSTFESSRGHVTCYDRWP